MSPFGNKFLIVMFLVGSMAASLTGWTTCAESLPDGSEVVHRLTVPGASPIQFMMSDKNTLWMRAVLPEGEETAHFGPFQIDRSKAIAVDLSPYTAQNIFLYHQKVYAVVTRQVDTSSTATQYLLRLDPAVGAAPRLLNPNIDNTISLTGVALGGFVLSHAEVYGAGFTFAAVCYGLIGGQRLIANAVNSVKRCRAHLRAPAQQAVDHTGSRLKFVRFVPGNAPGTAADVLLESPTSGRRYTLRDLERMSDCEFSLID